MDWKTERAKLLEKVDSGLQEYVADPAERAGIGPFGAGLSAGISAAADFFTPEDATDAALMAVGGPLLGKLGKIGKAKKLNKVLGTEVKLERRADAALEKVDLKDIKKQVMTREPERGMVDDEIFTGGYANNLARKDKKRKLKDKKKHLQDMSKYNIE